MNRFAFVTLFRSLVRHKLYALLNIGGLAVGIAVFLLLGLYVRFETGYEKWLPEHDKLYQVQEYWDRPGSDINGYQASTMGGLIDVLRQDFPGIVATRLFYQPATVIRGGIGTSEDFSYADANFLDLFKLPIVEGDGPGALREPSNVLLSQHLARKYFRDGNAVGQELTLAIGGGTAARFIVGAVFKDLPKATEQTFAMLARMPAKPADDYWNHWGSERTQTFVQVGNLAEAERLRSQLGPFVARRAAKDLGPDNLRQFSLRLTPVTDVHFQTPGRKVTVTTLGLVGLFTLLIAIVNYVNLATARAGLRAREVAMRKVLGANRLTLVRQFLGEAMLAVGVAALFGLALAELGLPLLNAAGGLSLAIPYALVLPALASLIVIVGTIAGLYPALLLSRFQPAAVLASARAPGGGRAGASVREALVVVQFALATAFIIGTAVLIAQTRHVRNADLGFRRDGLVIVGSTYDSAMSASQLTAFLDRVRRLPQVRAITTSDSTPGYSTYNSTNFLAPGQAGEGPSLQWITTGPHFFSTLGFRLLAGRLLDGAHRLDDRRVASGNALNVVVNRSAVRALGFATPEAAVGQTVRESDSARTIVGVVDDARFFSPRDPVNATVYFYMSGHSNDPRTTLRVGGDPRAMIDPIHAIWRSVAPEVPFDAKTAKQFLQPYYDADDRAARLFTIGAVLAVLIGCVGLWGLASFNTARRVKEIGIRKTLGASSGDIVKLLVGQFMRPVLIANLFGWPLAFFAMRVWLAGFDDRIALSPLFFIGATILALVIAALTVMAQSLRASRTTPAWALRHE